MNEWKFKQIQRAYEKHVEIMARIGKIAITLDQFMKNGGGR